MKSLLVALATVLVVTPLAAQTPAASPAPAPAQEPAPPAFRTGVEVITVDVGVVDRNGMPVTDLHAPEFTVKIDGQVRRVVTADLVKFTYTPNTGGRRPPPQKQDTFETLYTTNITQPEGRMIMIAVDQMNIRPGAARPILDAATRFLDRLNPADRVAFVSYPEPGIVVDFTGDRQRLRLAMQKVIGAQSRFAGRRNIGLVEAIDIASKGDDRRLLEVSNRECRGLVELALDQCQRDIVDESNSILWTTRRDTEASLRGLRQWLEHLRDTEGEKTLILLSEGLVTESPSDLDDVVRTAMRGRISVNVMLMDVPRSDATQGPLPPTFTEDRELQVRGLNDMASLTRGSIVQIVGTADRAFERLASEISAYYLLSVEQATGDRDGRNHRIDVSVRRNGVTLRSRQAFVLDSVSRSRTAEESLVESLRSPLGVPGVPLRLSTFVYQDPAQAGKVRIVMAADVDQAGTPPGQYTIGYIAVDSDGKVVASHSERVRLEAIEGRGNASLSYLDSVTVDPGVYDVRLAVVDAQGRHGSVVREVSAWKMAGEAFTYADLVVSHAAASSKSLRPDVEPHIEPDGLAGYIELYAASAETFKDVAVNFEMADGPDAPALVSVPATLSDGAHDTWRVARGLIGAEPLPGGRYVARARIMKGDTLAGVLVRPFILEAVAASAGGPILIPAAFARPVAFDRNAVLQPAVLGGMLDVIAARSPALKDAMAEARAGRYGTAAIEALTAGDQQAAAYLKGLDLYAKGQIDPAATQLAIAAGPRREFYPAALLLGACFAAGGRDLDAAGIWQMALGTERRPPVAYTLLADARIRGGQPAAVIGILKPAYADRPTDDEVGRRLAIVYMMTGAYADALPILDAYLTRHATDADALFAAVLSRYQVKTTNGSELSTADRATLTKYAQAYRGPQGALLNKYLSSMGVNR